MVIPNEITLCYYYCRELHRAKNALNKQCVTVRYSTVRHSTDFIFVFDPYGLPCSFFPQATAGSGVEGVSPGSNSRGFEGREK